MFYLSKLNKLTLFHSFILSNFNFCPLAWHFCSKANTIKLEKIQERALRFIYEDYNSTYEELLHIAKVPSLQIRRMCTMALECFKILYRVMTSTRQCNKVGHLFGFTMLVQHETDDVILYIHSVHKHRGNSLKLHNYKKRLNR